MSELGPVSASWTATEFIVPGGPTRSSLGEGGRGEKVQLPGKEAVRGSCCLMVLGLWCSRDWGTEMFGAAWRMEGKGGRCVSVPVAAHRSWVTVGKALKFSVPQFPCLSHGDDNNSPT